MERMNTTTRAWIELDRAALEHNFRLLRARLPDTCRLMPAVKANAYGHGAALVSRLLGGMGVRDYCVASAAEGAELRRSGVLGNILVLGYTHPDDFGALDFYDLTQTVVDSDYARLLNEFGKPLRVHVGVDTGMHRLGLDWAAIDAILDVFDIKNLRIGGVFTHLCAADSENSGFTLEQNRRFCSVVQALRSRGHRDIETHILNSYGILRYPGFGGSLARPGIVLYGMLSTEADTLRWAPDFRPVLSLKARIESVRTVPRGQGAGYGLAFSAGCDRQIAAVSIGYADGLPRSLSCGAGSVLINGRRAPIAGRICMDQTLVDVTGIPDVSPGGTAVIIGASGSEAISAVDIARQSGTITNEILSRLGPRLERIVI